MARIDQLYHVDTSGRGRQFRTTYNARTTKSLLGRVGRKEKDAIEELRQLNPLQMTSKARRLLKEYLDRQLRGQDAQLEARSPYNEALKRLETELKRLDQVREKANKESQAETEELRFKERPRVRRTNRYLEKSNESPEQVSLKDVLAQVTKGQLPQGAGLRTPQIIGDHLQNLSPEAMGRLMQAALGKEVAALLSQSKDTLVSFLSKGQTPAGRAELAKLCNLPRSAVLGLLMRAQLLTIGPGRMAESSLRAQHLNSLGQAGILTLNHLAKVSTITPALFNLLYQTIRRGHSSLARVMAGQRPVSKKDLRYWAKKAGQHQRTGQLILPSRAYEGTQAEAEELIYAWYLDYLHEKTWAPFEQEYQKEEKPGQGHDHGQGGDESREEDDEDLDLWLPDMEIDSRADGLICFWIERPTVDANRLTYIDRIYVCMDPVTGRVEPQGLE